MLALLFRKIEVKICKGVALSRVRGEKGPEFGSSFNGGPADFLLDWTVSLENIEISELIRAQVCARETKRTAFSLIGMRRLWAEQLG